MRTLLAAIALSSTLVAADAAPAAAPGTATVTHDGKPALSVTLPAGWTSVAVEAKTSIKTAEKHPHIQVWATSAADIVAAEKDAAKIVESEVTHFAASKTEAFRSEANGLAAATLTGTGEEADDGDPSQAEVTFFTVGAGRTVYVLISHGEGDGAAKQHANVRAIVESAKAL